MCDHSGINECAKNNGGCHIHAYCTDLWGHLGGYKCTCKRGFFGDGKRCRGK